MAGADWPTHDNKEWQKVLDRAYALGWPKPEWTKSHPKLVFRCPQNASQCTITAFSTGKGTESAAKSALTKIERCPHRDIKDAISRVDENLNNADRLLQGAVTLIARGELGERLDELVELASAEVDSAAEKLDAEFDAVAAEHTKLSTAARGLVDGEPDDHSPDELTGAASGHLRDARLALADLPKRNEEVQSRKERLEKLSILRDRLRER